MTVPSALGLSPSMRATLAMTDESQTQEQLVHHIEDLAQDELMPSVAIAGWKAGMNVPAIAKALISMKRNFVPHRH